MLLACQRQRLLADTLHQAAVTGDDIGVVVHHLRPQTGAQVLLGDGKAHRIGQTLTQGAGRGFDPRRVAIFRMARRAAAPLPERLDLVDRDVFVPGQVQQRIKQHRPVARRQDEPVTVGPMRGLRVKLEVLVKQHRGHIRHAHRHAGMARVGRGNGVKRQRADGAGAHPMLGVAGAQGFDVHEGVLYLRMRSGRRNGLVHSSLAGKFKHCGPNCAKIGLDEGVSGFAIWL